MLGDWGKEKGSWGGSGERSKVLGFPVRKITDCRADAYWVSTQEFMLIVLATLLTVVRGAGLVGSDA